MTPPKFLRLALPAAILFIGSILIGRSTSLTVEDPSRLDTVRMLAPSLSETLPDYTAFADQVASPITVNLGEIEPGQHDPNSMYDRWLRGEIDLEESASLHTPAEMAALREEALKLEPDPQVNLATVGGRAPTAGTSFDSLDYTECCGGGGSIPPDPELAVGPNHIIAVVNVALEIYNKSGTSLVGPITFNSFLGSDPNCSSGNFDPNANYDEEHDRFVLGSDGDGTHYCIAVSATSDPTGSWHIYSFATTSASANFFDYPHAGIGDDALYMGANMFNCAGSSCSFYESRIWAFDKVNMYAGNTASSATETVNPWVSTPQPLNLHGYAQGTWPTTNTHYFAGRVNTSYIRVISWPNALTGGTPSIAGLMNLSSETGVTASTTVDFPQQTGDWLQGNDYRLQDFEYRNGYGWTTQAIGCNPGTGTVNCIRWAQIDLTTFTVADAGVYSSNGDYRSFPDLAVNHCNDMAVGYTKSNTSIYPSIWVTGRESTDSAGTLQSEVQLKAGEIEYTSFGDAPHRWGDYTEMTIAPDGLTFWYLGEYSKNTGTVDGRWGTYIGSYSFGDCSVPATATPTATPANTSTPTATASNTATATATSTSTPTNSPTATDTSAPPTNAATATATNTSVPPTNTATVAATPTMSPSPTHAHTATATPSLTVTAMATSTTTATPTSSPMPGGHTSFLYLPLIQVPD